MKRSWRIVLPLVPFLVVFAAGLIHWQARRAVRGSAAELAAERDVRFEVRRFPSDTTTGFEWISGPATFSQAIQFRGRLLLCGPTGLLEYDAQGKLLAEYRVGRELPPSPLGRMAEGVLADSHEPELLITTASEGVLAFNGRSFRQIRPENPEARAVMAILPLSSGHLLIGTRKKGVLVYNGRQITSFHPTLDNVPITVLAGNEADLWAGTLDRGVLHWHAGQMESFGEAQGLPDAQVHSLSLAGDMVYVGTALGVAEFHRGRFSRVVAPGIFARALLLRGGRLLVGTMDQGVREIQLETRRLPAAKDTGSAELGEVRQLFALGDGLYALAQKGLYESGQGTLGWRKLLQPRGALLADGNVAALAVDENDRVWVGYFDRGLDVIEPNGQRARHVENEHVFCVNRILPGGWHDATAVATANGLVLFDRLGNQQQVLGRADGLVADHVTDLVPYRGGLAVATPAGITFLDARGPRSLYAFHGLVNNHVYTLAASGDTLLAGTLGGISVLDKEQIVANYTTATSRLKHNWITAAVPLGGEWVAGTYGAGVVRLDSTGRIQAFDSGAADFEVNPNAMAVTQRHVFAGSLGKGLYVYSRDSGRWQVVVKGLPSANVTALAAKNGVLYVGTDNGLVRIAEQELDRGPRQ